MTSKLQNQINTMFSDLKFDSQRHLYYVHSKPYISVSRKVEQHAPKFEANLILPYSAEKQTRIREKPVSIEELREEWRQINEEACRLGHETHDFMESFTGIETPVTPQQKAGVKFFQDYSYNYEILFRELRMYSKKFQYAGTEDLILQHKKDKSIITADYKTNKDLFKCYKGQRLLEPFDDLEATPYNKIQLQLSYYQIMLEEIGLKVADRWLVYLKSDGTYAIFKLWNFVTELKEYMMLTNIVANSN